MSIATDADVHWFVTGRQPATGHWLTGSCTVSVEIDGCFPDASQGHFCGKQYSS